LQYRWSHVNQLITLFLNMKAAGIPLEDMADRGKQMNAQRRLVNFGSSWLHLKIWTYHFVKNVCALFGSNDQTLSNFIFQLQGSTSIVDYIKTLVEISKKYGKIDENNCHTFLDLIKGSIMVYLMDLHSQQYKVVVNLKIKDKEEEMILFI
jgi:hypothetical protein